MEVTLLEPNNPSTILSETVHFRGRVSGSSRRPGKLSFTVSGTPIKYTAVEWRDESNDGETDWFFEGTLPVTEYIPATLTEQRDYILKAECSAEGYVAESNESTFTVAPRETWTKAFGGFLYPNVLEVRGPNLIIEGWAARRGAEVTGVTVSLGGKSFPAQHIRTWSPFVARTLPDLEEAKNAVFSIGISRKQFALRAGILTANLPLKFSAQISFSDGSTLDLKRARLRWRGPLYQAILGASEEHVPAAEPARGTVVFVTNNLRETEGAPKVLLEVVRAAVRVPNLKCHVISPYDGGVREQLEAIGAVVHVLPALQLLHYRRRADFLSAGEPAFQLLEKLNPEMIFGNTIEAFWAITRGIQRQRRTAWLIHESVPPLQAFEQLDPTVRLEFLEALEKTDRLIFVSAATRRVFGNPKNSIVIPNGVPIAARRERAANPDEPPTIICVGTVCERKGQDVLVEALAKLIDLPWRCLLVGARPSPFLRTLQERVRALQLEERITLIPETPQVEQYYAVADLAVIASREESAPLVSLEALARGIPLVSTDAFGLKEQLTGSDAALLIPINDPEALAAAIRSLLAGRSDAERLAANGPAWVEKNFSQERSKERYRTELASLLLSGK